MGKILVSACGVPGRACGSAEVLGGHADEPLEVAGEVALVPESAPGGDLRQREVIPALEQLLGPLDAPGDDVLVRGQAGGRLEQPGEVIRAEVDDGGDLVERDLRVEALLDVID